MQKTANQPRKRRKSTWDYLFEEAVEKGLEKGLEKGIEKGMEKGLEKGIEKSVKAAYSKIKDAAAVAELLEVEQDLVLKIIAKQ